MTFDQFRALAEPVQMIVAAGASFVAVVFVVVVGFIVYQIIKKDDL